MRESGFFAVVIAALSLTSAEAKLPRGVFTGLEIDAACAEAAKSRKGVALLLGHESSKSSSSAIQKLKAFAVVVFIEVDGHEERIMRPPVITALYHEKVGISSPRFAVTSPDLAEFWTGASARDVRGSNASKVFRTVKEETLTNASAWDPSKAYETLSKRILWWGLEDDKNTKGRFKRLGTEHLYLTDKDGKQIRYPFEQLTHATHTFAKRMSAMAAAARLPTFKVEPWTSSDGKVLNAKFVSLKGGELTLETDAGKNVSFPVSRLDTESAKRAVKHANAVSEAGG